MAENVVAATNAQLAEPKSMREATHVGKGHVLQMAS